MGVGSAPDAEAARLRTSKPNGYSLKQRYARRIWILTNKIITFDLGNRSIRSALIYLPRKKLLSNLFTRLLSSSRAARSCAYGYLPNYRN